MTAARTRDDLVIDRLVLHSVPVLDDVPPEELAALNAAHADWLYRLDAAGALLSRARRPHVHRLIVGGGQRNLGVVDGITVRRLGAWFILTLLQLRWRSSATAVLPRHLPGTTSTSTARSVMPIHPFTCR